MWQEVDGKKFYRVCSFVVLGHLFALSVLSGISHPKKSRQKIKVNECIVCRPQKVVQKQKFIMQPKTVVKKEIASVKKEEGLKIASLKKVQTASSKMQEIKANNKPVISLSKISALEKSLEKLTDYSPGIDSNVDELHTCSEKPLMLTSIAANEEESAKRMIQQLKKNLIIPEKGNVKVSFCIDEKGHITDICLIQYQSIKNWQYIKKELPKQYFPWFNRTKTETITINFISN